jgi:hypothetical protein
MHSNAGQASGSVRLSEERASTRRMSVLRANQLAGALLGYELDFHEHLRVQERQNVHE